jgi:hypothetical protein
LLREAEGVALGSKVRWELATSGHPLVYDIYFNS